VKIAKNCGKWRKKSRKHCTKSICSRFWRNKRISQGEKNGIGVSTKRKSGKIRKNPEKSEKWPNPKCGLIQKNPEKSGVRICEKPCI
jgi:hypothetical protein